MFEAEILWNKYVRLVPGRIRLKVPGLKGNDYIAQEIHNTLENIPGIHRVGTNLLTGTLLVTFDPTLVESFNIVIWIDDLRKIYHYPAPLPELSPMVARRAGKIFMITSALALLFAKQKILGTSVLSSSKILSNTATAVGLVVSYPVFLWGLKHPQQSRHSKYDVFIHAITFALLLLQESYTGLLLLLFVNYFKTITALDFVRTQQTIARIGQLPEKVWVMTGESEAAIPLHELISGDIVVVRNADTIPADGKVVEGEAVVDESRFSGLPKPIRKRVGSHVLAGTEILDGTLKILVQHTGYQTQLSQQTRKAVHRNHQVDEEEEAIFRERIDRMIYISLAIAGGTYLFTGNIQRSLTILLAASPGAAALAVPMANGVVLGKAIQQGIYVKKGTYLWDVSQVDTIVLDTVPTLTPMQVSIQEVEVYNEKYSQGEILKIAALVEGIENDPLIEAIRQKGDQEHFGPTLEGEEAQFLPKLGIRAKMKGKKILLGNRSLMLQEDVRLDKAESKVLRFKHLELAPIYLALDGKLCGLFGVRQTIEPEVRKALDLLRALGIKKFILLTRDSLESTEIIANQLGISEFYSRMAPKQKAELIKDLNKQGYKVAMLGDGIDDALAIAEAEIGISWGKKGADSAAKVAGIVITAQNPQVLVETMLLAQKTKEIAKQNVNLALGLNVIGLGLGVGGWINNVTAAFLSNVGTVTTVFNSYYQKWI